MARDLRPYIERLLRDPPEDRLALQRVKVEVAREVPDSDGIPANRDLLAQCTDAERDVLLPLLQVKPTRSLSGVAIVTVQASPEACPHGRCTFCPGGPDVGTAMSYTGHEPAARRALRHGFDAHEQAANRLDQLARNGHPVDKVELIVQGGTFPARDVGYQRAFVKGLYDALNGAPSTDLEEAHVRNETARRRCVGLTLETKPDWCLEEHVDAMLALGTTRVEIGIQTVFEEVLKRTNRGHTMAESHEATRIARDAGLKVCHHLMPGMPGSTPEMDIESGRALFEDARLRPDMLKIYPTLVIPGTPLHTQWERGEFEPLETDEAAAIVARIKEHVPRWVRIQRVERDIPTHRIAGGVENTNLRQYARDAMGRPCRCLRCRELARKAPDHEPPELVLGHDTYEAGGGTEHILSIDAPDVDAVVGYLRMRFPSPEAHRPELADGDAAIVREVKVTGPEVRIDATDPEAFQHKGHGTRLMAEAERIAADAGFARLLVISAVGTRAYYRKLGYDRVGVYMGRDLAGR